LDYGQFVDNGRGYEIKTPYTPNKWINNLFNDDYYMEVSQTLQGKSNLVMNYSQQSYTVGYRYFYLSDRSTGEVWNPNHVPLYPHIPDHWQQAYCERIFRNSKYRVMITRGEKMVKVNGKAYNGRFLPYQSGKEYLIEVKVPY
jgi:cellobiose phosphorylase